MSGSTCHVRVMDPTNPHRGMAGATASAVHCHTPQAATPLAKSGKGTGAYDYDLLPRLGSQNSDLFCLWLLMLPLDRGC